MENLNILLEDLAISMARMKDNHELLNRKMTLIRVDFSKDQRSIIGWRKGY